MPALLGQIETRPLLHPSSILARNVWFELIGYECHAQEVGDFHASQAAVRVVSAPAQTSKSRSAAADIGAEILPTDPPTSSLTWIIGPTYETNKEFQYLWTDIVEGHERLRALGLNYQIERARNNPGNGDMVISIIWGKDKNNHIYRAIIEGKSATHERSLQGEHVSIACLSEAAEHPQRIWDKYISTRYWRAILPTTPKPQAEWIREMIELGEKDPSLGTHHFHYPRHANPLYDHTRYERERKKAQSRSPTGKAEDDPYFAEQFEGIWVYYTGLVLPFNPRRHVVLLDPFWLTVSRVMVSCDYGYRDAAAALFWAVLPSGALLIFDEIYESHLTSEQFCDKVEQKLEARGLLDRLDYICGDPKKPEVEAHFRRLGLPVFTMNKQRQADRALGHRLLVDRLSDDEELGYPMLYVAEHCHHTKQEWKTLHYAEGHRNEYGSTAISRDDHLFDAARYFITTLPEPESAPEEVDWLAEAEEEVRQRAFGQYPQLHAFGLGDWALTGKSPYG